MNRNSKRYRQPSIIESFGFSKRPKGIPMETSSSNQEPSMCAAKVESSLEPQMDSHTSDNICQAANGCIKENGKSNENNAGASGSSIIDRLWDSSDENNKNSADLFPEENNKSSADLFPENNTRNSADLFPEESNKNSADLFPEENNISSADLFPEEKNKNSADLFPEEASFRDSVPCFSESEEFLPDSEKELFGSQSTYEEIDSSSDTEEPDYISILNTIPDCSLPLPKLEPLENHSIMFSIYSQPDDVPRPFPRFYRDKWGSDHVRMPCSPQNRYPVKNAMGESRIDSRWDIICRSLRADIGSSQDLEAAIMKYNTHYIGKWNFLGLHNLINQYWSEEERDHFFENLLPSMIEMALSLPSICTQSVPLLKQQKDHYVTLSQKQIGCLLLNAFFCTFPRRVPPNRRKEGWNSEYATYPDINFNRLFIGTKRGITSRNAHKLKCLFNYFRRLISNPSTGTVTFHRQVIKNNAFPLWHNSIRGIRTAIIKSHGLIEVDGKGMLQVDFANKFVGGGVIGQGCVQEEIRFITCPELIVSRLFVECLEKNEALIIIGPEQYNKYSGYSDTFKWESDFRDNIPRDSWGRKCTQIVAMDATHFKNAAYQFEMHHIKRELNKAYSAFHENASPIHLPAVATGNWGCGAFKGNPNLKFIIQLMAAAECGRSLVYFTFQNKRLKKEIQKMYEFLIDKNLVVGDLWRLLMSYSRTVGADKREKSSDLYDFIYSQFVHQKNCPQQKDGNSNELTDSYKKAAEMLFEEVACGSSSTEIEMDT